MLPIYKPRDPLPKSLQQTLLLLPRAPSYLNSRLLGYVTIGYIEPRIHYLGTVTGELGLPNQELYRIELLEDSSLWTGLGFKGLGFRELSTRARPLSEIIRFLAGLSMILRTTQHTLKPYKVPQKEDTR